MTKIKNSASDHWIVIEAIVQHSIKTECQNKHRKTEIISSL